MENWLEMMKSGDSPQTLILYYRFYVSPISSIHPGSFSMFWRLSHLLWTCSYKTRLAEGQSGANSSLQKWLHAGMDTWDRLTAVQG